MSKGLKEKKILEKYYVYGLSKSKIACSMNLARNTVAKVIQIFEEEVKMTWEDIKDKDEQTVKQLIFPSKNQPQIEFYPVDYDYIHKELKRPGVNLKLLHQEYIVEANEAKVLGYNYSTFRKHYKKYCNVKNVTSHVEHKPGVKMEVDYSGTTMCVTDKDTGELITVYLFVGVLPYSMYVYVEGSFRMDSESWLKCHINMFEFFGGTTLILMPDNLKNGIIEHPNFGEIKINESYNNMADYYNTAIIPAGVKKPKHKASVEGSVGNIATAVIAELRNVEFNSLYELNSAVREKVIKFNNQPFTQREGSRQLVFDNVEKETLKPLPQKRYMIEYWDYKHKVGYNSHVIFKNNHYSVPYTYIGEYANILYTKETVTIYIGEERVATHPRIQDYIKNQYQTIDSHMPASSMNIEWTEDRFRSWASKYGRATLLTIDELFKQFKIKQQAFNPARAILKLAKKYSGAWLEAACQIALSQGITSPRYNHLNSILTNRQEEIQKMIKNDDEAKMSSTTAYTRGKDYFG